MNRGIEEITNFIFFTFPTKSFSGLKSFFLLHHIISTKIALSSLNFLISMKGEAAAVPPFVQVVGYSNTGKTTLIKKLISAFKKRGLRVAAVKHAAHGYAIDMPGKDTWHYYEAGADQVMVVGPESLTIHQRFDDTPDLNRICKMLQEVDLILMEGFKNQKGPKIEVIREGYSPERLPLGENLIAVVADTPVEDSVPCFNPQDIEPLAEFILKRLAIGGST